MSRRISAFVALMAFPALVHAQVRGVPVENIDRGTSACTDFDAYANGQCTACTTEQYDQYFVEPGLHLQGKLVTGEALGDLGGVNLSYRAYERSREGKGPEPTVDGFTPEQQFFLAEAQWRGTVMRPEAARTAVSVDPHPPGRFRVLGPLSNMPEFAEAFSCKASDAMVRPPAQRCAIW